jgi:hypothetical protein
MNHRSLAGTAALLSALLLGAASPLSAQRQTPAPGSARAVAQRTLAALAARDPEAFAREVSPQDLATFRAQLLPGVEKAMGGAQRAQAAAMFAPARSYAEIEKLPAERLFALYLGAVMKRVGSAGPLQVSNTILGDVAEGDSLVHTVYRQRVRSGSSTANNVSILTLRRTPGGWKVVLEAAQLGMGGPQGNAQR